MNTTCKPTVEYASILCDELEKEEEDEDSKKLKKS